MAARFAGAILLCITNAFYIGAPDARRYSGDWIEFSFYPISR